MAGDLAVRPPQRAAARLLVAPADVLGAEGAAVDEAQDQSTGLGMQHGRRDAGGLGGPARRQLVPAGDVGGRGCRRRCTKQRRSPSSTRKLALVIPPLSGTSSTGRRQIASDAALARASMWPSAWSRDLSRPGAAASTGLRGPATPGYRQVLERRAARPT